MSDSGAVDIIARPAIQRYSKIKRQIVPKRRNEGIRDVAHGHLAPNMSDNFENKRMTVSYKSRKQGVDTTTYTAIRHDNGP